MLFQQIRVATQIFTQRHEMLSVLASFGEEEGGTSFSKGILAEPFEIGYDADWDCAGLGDDDYESVRSHGEGTVYELRVPTMGKDRFTVGRASATFDWGKFDWQKCDETTGSQDLHGKGITIDMESTGGRLSREREVESWREPDGSRHRLTERHVNRTAIGDVVVEGAPTVDARARI